MADQIQEPWDEGKIRQSRKIMGRDELQAWRRCLGRQIHQVRLDRNRHAEIFQTDDQHVLASSETRDRTGSDRGCRCERGPSAGEPERGRARRSPPTRSARARCGPPARPSRAQGFFFPRVRAGGEGGVGGILGRYYQGASLPPGDESGTEGTVYRPQIASKC